MRGRPAVLTAVALAIWTLPLAAQARSYAPKNGVLNWKALIFGGAFRITTVIPLHGDFSRFDRVEVVEAESLIPASDRTPATHGEWRQGSRWLADAVGPHDVQHPLDSEGDAIGGARILQAVCIEKNTTSPRPDRVAPDTLEALAGIQPQGMWFSSYRRPGGWHSPDGVAFGIEGVERGGPERIGEHILQAVCMERNHIP